MLPEITKVWKVEVNMISILTFCLWNIVEQHIILGVLGCLTHILDHNRCTLYRMSLLNEKWRSKWRQCSHSIYKESSTLKNPENDTLLDYIVSYIKIVKMEVTLTSTFYSKVTSSMIYIFFSPDLSLALKKNPKMAHHLTILSLTSKLSKWRSLWPPLFTPRWPPVWFTSFFNPDSSSAPWKTPKMTPYLTILHLTSKLSKWRSHWPPLFT